MAGVSIPDVSNIDLSKLGGRQNKGKNDSGPEFISSNPKGRDLFGRVVFASGVMWLGGFCVGGAVGLKQGWQTAAGPIFRIRMNSVINGVTRTGGNLGNTLAVIGNSCCI